MQFAAHFNLCVTPFVAFVHTDLYAHEALLFSSTRSNQAKRRTIFVSKQCLWEEKKLKKKNEVKSLSFDTFYGFIFGQCCKCSEHKAAFDVLNVYFFVDASTISVHMCVKWSSVKNEQRPTIFFVCLWIPWWSFSTLFPSTLCCSGEWVYNLQWQRSNGQTGSWIFNKFRQSQQRDQYQQSFIILAVIQLVECEKIVNKYTNRESYFSLSLSPHTIRLAIHFGVWDNLCVANKRV